MVDPRAELANNHHVDQSDPFRSTNDRYDTWGPRNFGARAERYENYRNSINWGHDDGVLFRPLNREDDESGVHSPPLWTASPPRHQINNHRTLSPTSRTQAIARGQRELMEIVKNMPESCYELSLKDLVEQPSVDTQEECLLREKNYDDDHDQQEVVAAHQRVNIRRLESKKNDKKSNRSMMRSGSMDNRGLFLKMVFPISWSPNKKKHPNSSTTCAKVSPKPEVSDRTSKLVDKDWWKKRSSCSIESDSSGRSSRNNNGSTGSSGSSSSPSSRNSSVRKKSGFFFSRCLPCFCFTNGKLAE